VLAERLARRFGLEVGYSVLPYDAGLHARVFGGARSRLNLLVGCVDNGAARRALTATLDDDRAGYGSPRPRQAVWWLDAGRNSGQVLLGNATQARGLRGAFPPGAGAAGRCRRRASSGPTCSGSPPRCGRRRTAPKRSPAATRGRP
jgi:hypothetical protein